MPNVIEQATAKLAGKVGGVTAGVKGLRSVFRKLAEEHKEAMVMLRRAAATTDPKKRQDIWAQLRLDLVSHERGEVRNVYPYFQANPATENIVLEHEADADELESVIADVDVAPFDSSDWKHNLDRLEQLFLRHVQREEEYFFPHLQESLTEDNGKMLEKQYLQAKQNIIRDL